MKKRIIKLIVCVMLISALMIGFCTAYASAATPVWLLRAKAGIAAAMMAANIVFEPIQAARGQALSDVIDPYNIVESVYDTSWDSYIDQSIITVRPDVVTIDGVEYSDIWLGTDAANSLRASGFDFKTAYNLLANQSTPISYADGLGYVDDIPIYSVNGDSISQTFVYPESTGLWSFGPLNPFRESGAIGFYGGQDRWQLFSGTEEYLHRYEPYLLQYRLENGTVSPYYRRSNRDWTRYPIFVTDQYVSSPFSFDYTSGTIDPDPIEDEQGLLLRVPSSYTDPDGQTVYNYDIHDLINVYPQVNDPSGHELVFDPSLNPDFEVDLDMGNALGDIITAVILAKLADLLGDNSQVIYAPMPDQPEPGPQPGVIDPLPDPDPAPDDPTSGTTIADTDWTKLDEILRWIQSTIDSIRHLTESLQTMLDSIFDAIQSVIESISELADKILEDIELGPAKLFDKALDILKSLFLPLLLPIRAMMNLWHYVVEWIQSISSPFTWIFGIMSGTSGNMVLPIYALLAGGICISIYKALGR